MKRTACIAAITLTITLAIAGCGGSDDNSGASDVLHGGGDGGGSTPVNPTVPTAPDTTRIGSGFYVGQTSANERVNLLILDQNVYYAFYSTPVAPYDVPRGVVTGNYSSVSGTSSGTFTTNNNALDFNLEAAGYNRTAGDLHGSFVPATSATAIMTYRNGLNSSLSGTYSTDYNYIATVDGLKGDYAGNNVTLDATTQRSDGIVVHIDASGILTVDAAAGTGCSFSGRITPRSQGKVWNLAVNFGPAPCLFPGQAMTGVAYYDPTTPHNVTGQLGQLFLFATSSDRQQAMLFTGKL
jgi:hypothetical protein